MMMKEVLLILLFLIHTINGDENIDCPGDDLSKLPDTCRSIDLRPLKITGDVDESVVRSKLKLITKITSGVEVTETGISTFDFLPNVEILTNKDGPALKFHRNKKLARIILPKLKQLKGKEEAVLFDHDQFPTLAKKEKKGLRDLTMLRDIAMKSTGSEGKATCNNFAKVIKNEPAESKGVWSWVWILPALVCAANVAFIAYSCLKEHRAKKEGGEGEKKKESQKKSAKMPVQENPKNK